MVLEDPQLLKARPRDQWRPGSVVEVFASGWSVGLITAQECSYRVERHPRLACLDGCQAAAAPAAYTDQADGLHCSRWHKKTARFQSSIGPLDTSPDISERPEKRIVPELSRYEDPDDPVRPPAPARDRKGLWAPPGPKPIGAPEVLVIGLGRRQRSDAADGPRGRLGAGAVEALQRRYQIDSFFDADAQGYMSTCRASLDKSGRAGVQKIHMMQPLIENDFDVAHAIEKVMRRRGMNQAMVLFVLSDPRLPFGQLRMRNAYDSSNPWLRSAYTALGPENRVTCLYVGAGVAARSELLAAEAAALPTVLSNAATAIEVWLSESDLGLVMRFVNRPEVYEMPPGWPYTHQVLEESDPAALPQEHGDDSESGSEGALAPQAMLPALGEYALFDLNRDNPTDVPDVAADLMSPSSALGALEERPPSGAILLAGRRYSSLAKLKSTVVDILLEQEPGAHLRFKDDEDAIKTLLSFHPDADRLLEDLVAVKVDCSPVDDDTRCLWVIKFDGYEEDVSLQTCLEGLERVLNLDPAPLHDAGERFIPRLGPGRWREGPRDSTYQRAKLERRGSKNLPPPR
ncbi:unnamed protein product [Effrenium voratum]|nr:unnamed protein product [Effrenium voratum]